MRVYRRCSSRRDENNGDAMRLALERAAGCATWNWSSFTRPAWSYPEEAAGRSSPRPCAVRAASCATPTASATWSATTPCDWSSPHATASRWRTTRRSSKAAAPSAVRSTSTCPTSAASEILRKLPQVYRNFIDLAMLDISRTPMEIAPTAHYSMGGVLVHGVEHQTDVEGLFAIGECAGGLHGANRLGGNSLIDCVVFGRIAGAAAAELVRKAEGQVRDHAAIRAAGEEIDDVLARSGDEFARSIQRAVRDTMNETCGVVRAEAGLEDGLRRLEEIERREQEIQILRTSPGSRISSTRSTCGR